MSSYQDLLFIGGCLLGMKLAGQQREISRMRIELDRMKAEMLELRILTGDLVAVAPKVLFSDFELTPIGKN